MQRYFVENLINKTKKRKGPALTGFARFIMAPDTYNTDVRFISRAHLEALGKKLGKGGGEKLTKAHWADLKLQIDRALAVVPAD